MRCAFLRVATKAIDADGSSFVHYVCHYENRDALEFLMMRLGPAFERALLKKNAWGLVPADFCAVCKDRSFKDRIDSATECARKNVKERQMSTRLQKAVAQAAAIVLQHADWFRVAHFFLAVLYVGPVLFRHGWIKSIAPFAFLQRSSVGVVATYAALSLARAGWHTIAARRREEEGSFSLWVYVAMALPFLLDGVRSIAMDVVLTCYGTFAYCVARWERLVHSRYASSRLSKRMTPSQREFLELVVYSAAWCAASSLGKGRAVFM
jgi:hypothetical protein